MIKKEWKLESMGDLCDISSSKRIFMKEYVNEGIPFYRSKEIIKKHHDEPINETLYISTERYEEIKEKYGVPIEGDLLLTSVGTLGVPYLVKKEDKFYFKDGNLTWFKNFRSDVLSEYIYYWFQSDVGKREIDKITIGSTQKAITIDSLKKLSILLPPINVQRKICDILHSINYKITLNKRINSTLEEMAMTLYKHWFVDFGPFQDGEFVESELGMIPKGWRVISCYDLANYINGKAFKTNQLVDNDGLPVIKIAELKSGITNSTKFYNGDIESKYLLQNGDILFAWSASLGVFIWAKGEAVLNQHIFNVKPNGTLSKSMIYFTLKNIIQEFIEIAASRATTMGHITKQHLIDKKIALPPDKLLVKVDEKMSNCYQMILSNMLEVERLTQIRDYLLPRLLSGEIDVSKAEKQVEEVL